jgi:hypothetical protein
MVVQRDPLPDLESSDLRLGVDDRTGRFMPKNARRWHGAVLDFLDVRRAHTANGYPD